jgi:hypothetical protein
MILACRFDCQVTCYRTSNEPAYFKEGQFYVTVHWGGKPMRNRVNDIIDTHTHPAPRRKRYARGVILICAKKTSVTGSISSSVASNMFYL